MIMKFALLLGYTAAALGMSMPTKDALPVRATTFASLDLPEHDDFKPTINECGSSSRTKIIWEHDAMVDGAAPTLTFPRPRPRRPMQHPAHKSTKRCLVVAQTSRSPSC